MKTDGLPSALSPMGSQAERIGDLWWLMFWVCAVVMALVTLALLGAMIHSRRRGKSEERQPAAPESRRRIALVVAGSLTLTVLILFGLLLASVSSGRDPGSRAGSEVLTIEVTGHQWWWEIGYPDPVSANLASDANEIHIPVGRPVRIRGTSRDVIHSFWIPSLHGKKDLVPGHIAETWIQADKPGIYHGMCAEFCGQQHAQMRFLVVAEPPEEFEAWLAAQRQPAPAPETPLQIRGQQVFFQAQCALCHTIRGTTAAGTAGPDLTHIASRRTLGAGILPNTRDHLGRVVVNTQSVKPGSHMPPAAMGPDDLPALLAYLESLK